jgi:general secretion pathway protein K
MTRRGDSGVVLLNVLVILALCAGLLVTMLRVSDIGIARSGIHAEAAQALAVALAGETSAVAALRRDLAEAPLSDHPGEAWAAVAQRETAIAGGSFALQVADAQARLNLTGLTGVLALQRLQALAAALDLRPEVAPRLALRLARPRPAPDLPTLADEAGLTAEEVRALAPLVTLLPEPTPVNLNTCPDALLPVLFGNPVTAAALAERRARQGYLTADDLAAVSAVLPPGTGFVSRFYAVDTAVRIGAAELRLLSLLQRGFGPGAVPVVRVVRRQAGA